MSSSIEKGHGWLLVAVCTSLFFMPFMMAGVNAVLPPLGQGLNASARELGLLGAFYSMGLAVFQLASGSMGDIWGYRRVFLWGIALFAVAGALLGFVHSVPLFLVLRFVQGVGGAMFNACGLALRQRGSEPPTMATAGLQSMRVLPAGRRLRALWPVGLAGSGCFGAARLLLWACC